MKSRAARFLEKVKKTKSCWLWQASLNNCGYGRFQEGNKARLAHRVAHELFIGPIPTGLLVLHKCDVRNCVNPRHIELGTHKKNTDEMFERGRANKAAGARHHGAVLKEGQVLEIRRLSASEKQCSLAEKFKVSPQRISKIVRGEQWKHI